MPRQPQDYVGVGLYAPAEAARYARIAPRKFSRWLYSQKPVFQPQLGKEEGIVTFMDFAQSLSILDIRLMAGVPLQKIRKAYEFAQKSYDVAYPFGVRHGMFIFGNLDKPKRCNIGIFLPRPGGSSEDEQKEEFIRRVQLTGRDRGATLINVVVQEFSKRIEFNPQTSLASRYVAHESNGFKIVMDPSIRFGKPFIEGVGYEAETLAEAAVSEGGIDRAARLYHVEPDAVRAALDYHRLLNEEPLTPKPAAA